MKVERKAEADWPEAKLGRCRAGSAPSTISAAPRINGQCCTHAVLRHATLRQPGRSCSAIMRRARCHKQCFAYDWATKLAGALQRDPGLARLCAMRKGSRQAKGETLAAAALHTPDTLKEGERRVGKLDPRICGAAVRSLRSPQRLQTRSNRSKATRSSPIFF